MPLHPLQINKFHVPEFGMKVQDSIPSDLLELPLSEREKSYSALDVNLNISLLDQMDTLLVMGSAKVNMDCICDRCSCDFVHELEAREICHHIENCPDIIDLTEYIREDILLSFPQHYLCSEQCEGLCVGCGANLNKESCSCSKPDKNNSFNILDELKFD